MHEMLCVHIGQCGLQIGFALWELLSAEHGINRSGKLYDETDDLNESYGAFFSQSNSGQFVPRGIFIDLEPTVIDQMRTGSYSELYHPDQLISGSEDGANNFARGFHTVGRIVKKTCENRIRKEFELSGGIQGIHIYRSLGGGTGSGMTATLFEIFIEYAKVAKVEIPIHPSPHLSSAVVEPYNSILSEHFCMEDTDISFLIDNESLYDITTDQLAIKEPVVHNINRLVAQVCSSLTASSRFENELYNDFNVLTNLVPYPRIHFPLVSYAPFGNESKEKHNQNTISEITRALFDERNQIVKCDPSSGKYMSCSIVYRGKISLPEVYKTICEIKSGRLVRFVDWCPTGFKVGVVNLPPVVIPESRLAGTDKNAIMMTNNSAVSSVWHRLAQKFHRLYAKRSFVHWFVAEGLEESEFCESLYNIATLAKDYEEVALDTKPGEFGRGSPQHGEGGGSPGANTLGEGAVSPATDGEAANGSEDNGGGDDDGDAEGGDDDGDDEDGDDEENNENISNAVTYNKNISNYEKSNDLFTRLETLISTLYKSQNSANLINKSENHFVTCKEKLTKNIDIYSVTEQIRNCEKNEFTTDELESTKSNTEADNRIHSQQKFSTIKNVKSSICSTRSSLYLDKEDCNDGLADRESYCHIRPHLQNYIPVIETYQLV